MPTTSNFGWTTPADTDLVKDGAAAIRTLGNGIDTSLVDLKGGTTGQILSKASNTDLDYTWITNDVGDITAVTAGTGISGGGTSGAVTITNSMATEITAAGDIIVGTGSGTFDNLPIGTTGQVLTADTTVSPYKVKWADSASASGPAFSVTRSGAQNITGGVTTKIQWNSEIFDTDNCFDSTTNYRFTPTKAGKYQINVTVGCEDDAAAYSYCYLYKNGSSILQNAVMITTSSVGNTSNSYAHLVDMNGTTDYLEVYVNFLNSAAINDLTADRFSGVWIRS